MRGRRRKAQSRESDRRLGVGKKVIGVNQADPMVQSKGSDWRMARPSLEVMNELGCDWPEMGDCPSSSIQTNPGPVDPDSVPARGPAHSAGRHLPPVQCHPGGEWTQTGHSLSTLWFPLHRTLCTLSVCSRASRCGPRTTAVIPRLRR